MSSPARERLTARVAPAGIQNLSISEPSNVRPKPRIAWHRRPLFSPGLDGDHLTEHLEGPAGEEWTFRETSQSQSVCLLLELFLKFRKNIYIQLILLFRKIIILLILFFSSWMA